MRTIFNNDRKLVTRQVIKTGTVLASTTSATAVLLDSPPRNTTLWTVSNTSVATTVFFEIVHPEDPIKTSGGAIDLTYRQSFFQLGPGESFTLESMDGTAQVPARAHIYIHTNGVAGMSATESIKLFSY